MVSRGMDVSSILILPFSALVAFAAQVWAGVTNRPAPRLIWPCAVSTAAAALLFLRPPGPSEMGMWAFALLALAVTAAIGTVIGAAIARLMIKVFRSQKRG